MSMSTGLNTLYRFTNLIDVLRTFKELKPQHVCIRVAENSNTTDFDYATLWTRAILSGQKIASCTQTGDRVLLPMPTSPEFIDAFFGCMISGRIPVPLPVERSGSRFSRIGGVLEDCQPTLILFKNGNDRAGISSEIANVKCRVLSEISVSDASEDIVIKGSPTQVAFIQYTSGSTSQPKGVVLTHENLIANLRMIQQGMMTPETERSVSWLPLHHDMGLIGNLLLLVSVGGFAYVYPYQEFARNPLSWLEAINEQRGTLAGCPNFGYAAVIKKLKDASTHYDLSSIRLMYCGSERIAPPIIAAYFAALRPHGLKPETFFPCYGLAEASLYVSGAFENPFDVPQLEISGQKYPVCGFVATGLSTRVCDSEGNIVGPKEVGEIEISGPSVSPGYWKSIASNVTAGELQFEPSVYLKTGDLGCIHQNQVVITGRAKDLIKINGKNIYPEDIELLLEQNSSWIGPNSVVVAGFSSDHQSHESLEIFIEAQRNRRSGPFEPLLAEVQQVLNQAHLRCENLIVVSPGNLPKTSSGKKQRSKTRIAARNGTLKILWKSNPLNSEIQSLDPVDSRLQSLHAYFEEIDLALADERRSFPANFVHQLRRSDVLGLLIPKDQGGAGLNHSQFAKLASGLGEIDITLGAFVGIQNTIGTLPILRSPVLNDKNIVLQNIARDGAITAFAITESAAGSNPRALSASARPHKGKLRLSGEKLWIGNAELASYISVFVKEFDSKGDELGISAFLLRRDRHDFRVSEEQLTVGLRSMPQNRVILDGCILDEIDRLSLPGEGLRLAYSTMEYARFGLAALAVGSMKNAADRAISYAKTREIWTGNLGQNVYFNEAMKEIELRASALSSLVDLCAKQLATQDAPTNGASLAAKILCGEWGFSACDQAMQFCGGRGYTETFGIGRLWKDSRILRIFEGPTEALAFQLGVACLRDPSSLFKDLGLSVTDTVPRFEALCKNLAELTPIALRETVAVHVGITAASLIAYALLSLKDIAVSPIAEEIINFEIEHLERRTSRSHALLDYSSRWSSKASTIQNEIFDQSLYDQWPTLTKIAEINQPRPNLKDRIPENGVDDATKGNLSQDKASKIRSDLRTWLTTFTRVKQIDDATSMGAYGLDSLLGYELICFVEETYSVNIPESSIAKKPSINDLTDLIMKIRS